MKNQFKPFSNNIIFFDTEFSSNDLSIGELLSIGVVKMSGEELYIEFKYSGPVSSWVKKYIIPTLKGQKVGKDTAIKKIAKFVGKNKPYLISYVIPYDSVYLHKLFGSKDFDKMPFHAWPIDFASVLFSIGLNPDSLKSANLTKFAKEVGVDVSKYKLHNALDDARLLREVYLKVIGN